MAQKVKKIKEPKVQLTPEEQARRDSFNKSVLTPEKKKARNESLKKARETLQLRCKERREQKELDKFKALQIKEQEKQRAVAEKAAIEKGIKSLDIPTSIQNDILDAYYQLGGKDGLVQWIKANKRQGLFYEKMLLPLIKAAAGDNKDTGPKIQVNIIGRNGTDTVQVKTVVSGTAQTLEYKP